MNNHQPKPQLTPVTQACLLLSMLSGIILGVVAFRHLHPTEQQAEVHIGQALQQIRKHYVEDIDETISAVQHLLWHRWSNVRAEGPYIKGRPRGWPGDTKD